MAAFSGKWKLTSKGDFDAFLDAVKATDAYREQVRAFQALANSDYYEEIDVDPAAKTLKRTSYVQGKAVKQDGPINFGEEFDDTCHGKPAKVTTKLESDTKILRKEVGSDFTASGEIEVKGNELFATFTCNGVTINTTYERI